MSLIINLDAASRLCVSVEGDFNCQVARDLLQRIKAHWRTRATPVLADLSAVTQFTPCAISLLVFLLEMREGDFELERCSADLEQRYVAALMTEDWTQPDFATACNCRASTDPAQG
jgi:hypothetical protein